MTDKPTKKNALEAILALSIALVASALSEEKNNALEAIHGSVDRPGSISVE